MSPDPLAFLDRGINLIKGLKLVAAAEFYAAAVMGLFMIFVSPLAPDVHASEIIKWLGLLLVAGVTLSWPIRLITVARSPVARVTATQPKRAQITKSPASKSKK